MSYVIQVAIVVVSRTSMVACSGGGGQSDTKRLVFFKDLVC